MKDLVEYYKIIEAGLERINLNPIKSRGNIEGSWSIIHNKFPIWIDLWSDNHNNVFFQVSAPLTDSKIQVDDTLYQELLEINSELCGFAFCLIKGKVVLKETQYLHEITPEEIGTKIFNLCNYLDSLIPHLEGNFADNINPGIPPYIE